VYAGPLEVPCCGVTALVCANWPQCSGRLKVVDCSGCCRNFQVRPQGRIQPKPSELPKPAAGAETPTVARPPQPPDGKVCYIPLTQGKCTMIDAADYERVSQHKWHVTRHGDKFYACRKQNGKKCFMHRFLMDTPEGMVVDHINGNSLNNRRSPNDARGPPDGPAKEHGAQMRPPPSETGGLRSLTRVHRMRIASNRCLGATERMPQPS
jgi:hypothetical protein